MTVSCEVDKLAPLVDYLDGLASQASVPELCRRLLELEIGPEDVAGYARFDETRYLRNLICAGEQYHVLALCWRSGQRSPIHNHAGSTCGVRVVQGIATETKFESSPCGLIKAVSSIDRLVGQVCASLDTDIHQVSNLQEAGRDLITLHVYSPPLLRMDTYSLVDRHVGEFRPMVLEHDNGSGI